jgi:hypothetical protein
MTIRHHAVLAILLVSLVTGALAQDSLGIAYKYGRLHNPMNAAATLRWAIGGVYRLWPPGRIAVDDVTMPESPDAPDFC